MLCPTSQELLKKSKDTESVEISTSGRGVEKRSNIWKTGARKIWLRAVPWVWTTGTQAPTKQASRQAKSHRFMVQTRSLLQVPEG